MKNKSGLKDAKAVIGLLCLIAAFLFAYSFLLYFVSDISFMLPVVSSLILIASLIIVKKSYVRDLYSLLIDISAVIFLIIALYVLFKIFQLNLGYSL